MFSYGKQLFLGELKKLKLHLPSYKNQPNWKYMENYIKKISKSNLV
jgi:hypothetical protein